MDMEYFVGLDLGQAADYTALAIVERPPWDGITDAIYSVRHLQRYPLGTPYTDIVPGVESLMNTYPLRGAATLVVDYTGVGRALVDMLRRSSIQDRIVPITITGGQAVSEKEDGSRSVPKKDLVTSLQVLFQGRRLKVARGMAEADVLVAELNEFRVKITAAANETFGAADERRHDDLVLSVALACWFAEHQPHWGPNSISWGGKSLMADAPRCESDSDDSSDDW